LLNFAVDEAFLRELDKAARAAGYGNRSQFIRDAIFEKLERMGLQVPAELKAAPPRSQFAEPIVDEAARQAALRARHLIGAEPPPLKVLEGQATDAAAGEGQAAGNIAPAHKARRRLRG
jgi:Arc/MetJ-type ribon-helix-helix transcriptional regulator